MKKGLALLLALVLIGSCAAVASAAPYWMLKVGSSGQSVRNLQQRLTELNYYDSAVDGDYGNKTKAAVEMFQLQTGLKTTGIADETTQTRLFAEDAPKAKLYEPLVYATIARQPEQYWGNRYCWTGRVLQVQEQDYGRYIYVTLDIATNNAGEDPVCVVYYRSGNEPPFSENQEVTVYARCTGEKTRQTPSGESKTSPGFLAEFLVPHEND